MVVIGAGRIGLGLAGLDPQLRLLDRERGWEQLDAPAGDPIFVAVRNDDLDAVIDRVPAHRRADLVFTQNGMLRDYLANRGLSGATRGLLFFAVPARGDRPQPGAASPFWGPHARALATWLGALGLEAEVLDAEGFAALELEKLIWNCAFGLCCEAFDADVGTVVEEHSDSLRELVDEMNRVGGGALEVRLELEPLLERLCDYSRSIASYRGAVKEWEWRNGWFVQRAQQTGAAMPRHRDLLERIGR